MPFVTPWRFHANAWPGGGWAAILQRACSAVPPPIGARAFEQFQHGPTGEKNVSTLWCRSSLWRCSCVRALPSLFLRPARMEAKWSFRSKRRPRKKTRPLTPAHLIAHTSELVSFSGKRCAAHVGNVFALYFSAVYRAAPLWSTARLESIKGRLAAVLGGGRRKSARIAA
ncbi:hypothetical protein TRVL_06287 [Trypanosoma vivax]|nr:hypothetical protein TRVL_06287 [Trypanosoma vivax]